MRLDRIILQHFRLFEQEIFELHPRLTLIIGRNTRGKTSLLEGIFTVIYGEGFRETRESELITWDQQQANIGAVFMGADGSSQEFQVLFRRAGDATGKVFFVEKTKKTHHHYLSFQTRAVLFTPENIEIITGSPALRRSYFDRLLSAADVEYKKRLTNYEHALRKRNKILEQYRQESSLHEELRFWNDYLIENGGYLTAKRERYCAYLNENPKVKDRSFSILHKKNEISIERLQESFELEKRVRKTLIGPQKDDYEISLTDDISKNVHLYGSRSEQRIAMFWLKLNEIRYLEEQTGKKPLLLLDDVFSELDQFNKKIIMQVIGEYQTILTSTEEDLIELADSDKHVIHL
ncbi:MAG: DNA replication and repair protein RecF [Patescibacteria group bacterium]|nr:DNA replication and repair protein RecF [Patescibacteria group bacterium]